MTILYKRKSISINGIMENLFYFPFIFLTYIFEWLENKLEDDESLEYPDIYIEPTENILIEKVIKLGIQKSDALSFNRFAYNPGFTLIELILVISAGLIISFLSFQKMVRDQEDIQAKAVGEQIKQIGNAVNSYIAVHYDKLSSLSNSDGSILDAGPRTCVAANSSCSVSIQTLINEGLLPLTYSSKNLFDSPYTIVLKRSGTSPYYNVAGLITTDNAWRGAGNSVRFDLLGKAMQEAGVDSGMSRDASNILQGYKGLWNHNTTEFSNVNKLGQLGYQVGYGSYSYSIYLRRDGTLPMTGNLNMGTKSINNAQDINGAGNLTMAGRGNFGSEVTAKNGYGDSITLGGDASSNDYELRLGSGKPLAIYSPNSTQYSTVLSVNRNTVIGERLATNGLNPNDLPAGWSGGVRTNDVYAAGTIAAGNGGNVPAYMNSSGNIYASNSIATSGNATINGSITVGGNVNTGGETYTGGWFRTRGDTGWYSEKWGGGWYMSDNTWVRSYNNKNVYTAGQMKAGSIQSDGDMNAAGNASVNGGVYTNYLQTNGRLVVGEYGQLNGVANVGWGCSPNGLIGRDITGEILSCSNGIWKKSGIGNYIDLGSFETKSTSGTTTALGNYKFCMVSGVMSAGDNGTCRVYPSGGNWYLNMVGYNGSSTQRCWVGCIN